MVDIPLQFPPPTKRLLLRNWLASDLEDFIGMNSDEEVMEFFPSIQSRAETLETLERIHQCFQARGFGLYALEKTDDARFIGFTGFSIPRFTSFFTPCVEIGWRLKKEYWNRGYATEAAKACIDFGFSVLQFTEIFSFTSVVNKKSIHVMEKIGMTKLGNFEHPFVGEGHKLRPHVVYSISR